MTAKNLSFSTWPFPGHKTTSLFSMSKFGMLAYAMDTNLTIFAEEMDRFTPLLMFEPFNNRTTNQSSIITAIGWYDASRCFEVSLPVIVISSRSGLIIVFDIRSRKIVASYQLKNEHAVIIKWSPYSTSSFYVGTNCGGLIKFDVDLSHIVTSRTIWEIRFPGISIDFLAIDEIDGSMAAIASKSGSFGIVYNLNGRTPTYSPELSTFDDETTTITCCTLFPFYRHFLIIVTNKCALLHSIEESVTIELLRIPEIQAIQISKNLRNQMIIVKSDSVELWQIDKDKSQRICQTKLAVSQLNVTNEIQLVDVMTSNTIVLMTYKHWLTTVQLKYNKLFVTKRVKLFNSRPMDFNFANDSFAFCTEDGQVMVTRTTNPKFKMQMKWKTPKPKQQSTAIKAQSAPFPSEETKEKVEPKNDVGNDVYQTAPSRSEKTFVPGKRRGISRRYSTPDILDLTKKGNNHNFKKQQTFDPLPEDDELLSQSIIPRHRRHSNNSFEDLKNDSNQSSNDQIKLTNSSPLASSQNRINLSLSLSLPVNKMNHPIESSPASENQLKLIENADNSAQSPLVNNQNQSPLIEHNVNQNQSNLKGKKSKDLNENNFKIIDDDKEKVKPKRRRRLSSSMMDESSDLVLKQITEKSKQKMCKETSFTFAAVHTPHNETIHTRINNHNTNQTTENPNPKEGIRTMNTQNLYGNNCSFLWSYQVGGSEYSPERPNLSKRLNHVEWITGTRLLAWNQDSDYDPNVKPIPTTKDKQRSTKQHCVVYSIDLKMHSVTPLINKDGMSITSVIVSKNRQLFAVVMNGFIVSIYISNNPKCPYLLGTSTFPYEVIATFMNDIVVMIHPTTYQLMVTAPIDMRKPTLVHAGKKKLAIKSSYGSITCSNGCSKGIFLGTSRGFILKVEASTYAIVEIHQMEKSIVRFRWTSVSKKDTSFLATDSSGSTIMVNDEGYVTKISGHFYNAIPITPLLMIGTRLDKDQQLPNNQSNNPEEKSEYNFIEAVSVVGKYYKPIFPTVAARNPLMKPRSKWKKSLIDDDPSIEELPKYGIPLVYTLIDAERNPDYSFLLTRLLRDLIINMPTLWHTAFRFSLLIKDNETAKKLLDSIKPTSPDYMACILKRALFGSISEHDFESDPNFQDVSNGMPESMSSILESARNLATNGHLNDAVDILLISGLWIYACKLLIENNKIIESIAIARVIAQKRSTEPPSQFNSLYMKDVQNNDVFVLKELAEMLLSQNNRESYSAILLCEGGFIKDVMELLIEAGESEQSQLLAVAE